MVYKYIIPTLCICTTMSLYAEEQNLSDIIQKVAEDKALIKPVKKKQEVQKKRRFVFKDEYDANGIGKIDKTSTKEKSESFDYENPSRFKFKFNDGSQQSNLTGGFGSAGMSGSMAAGGSSGGGGGGRR